MNEFLFVSQMDPSDTDFDPDPERETTSDGEEAAVDVKAESQLDFYQTDPFTQGDRTYHSSSLNQ